MHPSDNALVAENEKRHTSMTKSEGLRLKRVLMGTIYLFPGGRICTCGGTLQVPVLIVVGVHCLYARYKYR